MGSPDDDTLREDVRRFISQHIRSVVQLEALLLLRLDAERWWSATELGAELRVDPRWTQEELARFCEAGLLECVERADQPRYRFQHAHSDLHRVLRDVAQAYLTRRMSIIDLIYTRSSDSVREFADAFRIRREEDDGG